MKKIITALQTQKTDKHTIENEPISSLDLMERASERFVTAIENRISKDQKIAIVCGTGNNGGDGLAVARILISKGYSITPFLVQFSSTLSPDCKKNFDKLSSITQIESVKQIPSFTNYDLLIDAIFGSGLTRPILGLPAKVISKMNSSATPMFSIDIPSGLYCDTLPNSQQIIKSTLTISFQRPKLSFFFSESEPFINEWKVIDIGLNEVYIQQQETEYYILDSEVSLLIKARKRHSHKGTYGHALLMAGSYGKIGAAVLASKACLRSGTGLLTSYIPKCGYEILQTSVPEAMCLTDKNDSFITTTPNLSTYDAIGVGPGLDKNKETRKVIKELLQKINQPLVLDADALNIISEDKDLLDFLPENTILTPHPKEFERLTGVCTTSRDRLLKQKQFSIKYKCIVVLKGAYTSISSQKGDVYFNTSGNSGMATGGSGDVLTGIITGLLAQRYEPLEAALIGVYFHGKAGDKAMDKMGQSALIASDIIDHLKINLT